MFFGVDRHRLDAKGRLTLPSDHRDEFERGVVVAAGMDHCLTVHTLDGWRVVLDRLRQLPDDEPWARNRRRALTGYASKQDMDAQGRIIIPPPLRAYARLGEWVFIVGADTALEVWDTAAWEAEGQAALEEFANTGRPAAAPA